MIDITAKQARSMKSPINLEEIGKEITQHIRVAANEGGNKLEYTHASFIGAGKPEGYGIHSDLLRLADELHKKGFGTHLSLNREDVNNIYVKKVEVFW
jgi:hypothetical protein